MPQIRTNKKIKSVIFDLDGTLVDSEPIYFEADRKLLENFSEIKVDDHFKNQYLGIGSYDMLVDLKKRYNIQEPIEDLLAKKNQIYLDLVKNAKTILFPEMKIFLEILKEAGYLLAVASGSSKEIIHEILSLTNIIHFFDTLVSAEEVAAGKPHPHIFLEASRRLQLQTHSCVVIEDSWPGVKAAKNAEMICVAIPSLTNEEFHPVFSSADLLIKNGISEFSANYVFDWIETIS